jgi:imidazolonepropionase-like amidohydrolase
MLRSSLPILLLSAPAHALTVDCGRVLDVATGRYIDDTSIQIVDQRFGELHPRTRADAGGPRIDLREFTCLPGLMDMHVHLTSETRPQSESFRETLSLDPADHAFRAAVYAERTLRAGFTTVRDLGANDGLNVALKRAIEQGWVRGPRLYTSGKSIASTGGHADPSNSLNRRFGRAVGAPRPEDGVADGPEAMRAAVRGRYKEGADLIKITATGGVLSLAASGQNPQFADDELRALIAAARDYGYRVAAHAHGAEGMKRALCAGVDSIEHGTYMDAEAIRLFRQTGAWYVPTISAGRFVADKAAEPGYYAPLVQPKAAAIGPQIQDTFARAYRGGVKIAFGTDAGVFPHGDNAAEFVYMVEAGMPPLDAIRSATLAGAELLGEQERLGRIAPGYAADLIAVAGDPLADIGVLRDVRFVMRDGVVFKQP